ncbi:MAG: AI-2E family transporter [Coriobacteriia bacterium]|nr:AI-2E family transporter [Coriobacteriia bacterium]
MSEQLTERGLESWRRLSTISWALIGVFVLVAAGLWVFSRIAGALTPLLLALLVVFVLRRPVKRLEAAGLSRSLAVVACYLIGAAALTVFGVFVIPAVGAEFRSFSEDFPRYYDSAFGIWSQIESEYLAIELPAWITEAGEAARESIITWLTGASRNLAQATISVGGQILGFFLNVFLALALAFFVLRDLPTLKSELLSLPGPARQEESFNLAAEVTDVIEGFIRGQGIIAIIVGTLTAVGLWVLGVPYALLIGLIAGITNLIPYLGPLVGGAIAAISAAFVSPQLVLWTIVYIVVIQQLESTFLQPRIMSDQVHLHPVLVILSLLVGATLFGLIGMLLAVPIAGVAKVMFVHYYEKWTASSISHEKGALFRKPKRRGVMRDDECVPVDEDSAPGDEGRSGDTPCDPDTP